MKKTSLRFNSKFISHDYIQGIIRGYMLWFDDSIQFVIYDKLYQIYHKLWKSSFPITIKSDANRFSFHEFQATTKNDANIYDLISVWIRYPEWIDFRLP